MNFLNLKVAVAKAFADMVKGNKLYRTAIDKDTLWDTYLSSFPEGTNPIFRKRGEYDCNCCKQFIRAVGDVVAIVNGKFVSIWDIVLKDSADVPFQVVADAMSEAVKSHPIENEFLHYEKHAGTDKSIELRDAHTHTWNHFFINIPTQFVVSNKDMGTRLGETRTLSDMLYRALTTITQESIDTVLELIAQNSIYKGEEYKFVVTEFKKVLTEYINLGDERGDLFVWDKSRTINVTVSRIRNSAIGTLLVDLSEGKDLEFAVKAFETKVAPINYKRKTALATPKMIANAKSVLDGLGLTSALNRRYAKLDDIKVNDILYCNRQTRNIMTNSVDDVFGDLMSSNVNTKAFNKVEEVGIEKFIKDILPNSKDIEILVENKFEKNFVSLITASDPTAARLFKWDNPFSWSYNGEVTDSFIIERVKEAGGSVEGDVCARLAWSNYDDLDAYMIEPDGYTIYFGNRDRLSPNGGMLDVDMNAGAGKTRTPVENIYYSNRKKMKDGIYTYGVNQYNQRELIDVGFQAEISIMGETYRIDYNKALKSKERVEVMKFKYDKKADTFTIIESLESKAVSKKIWNLDTNQFHKVNVMAMSPNFWEGEVGIGNKHYFFMIDKCQNDLPTRGFYNEFLRSELDGHRASMEMVASKLKTEAADNQLSGLGFSSTQRNTVTLKVNGAITRVIKVVF